MWITVHRSGFQQDSMQIGDASVWLVYCYRRIYRWTTTDKPKTNYIPRPEIDLTGDTGGVIRTRLDGAFSSDRAATIPDVPLHIHNSIDYLRGRPVGYRALHR